MRCRSCGYNLRGLETGHCPECAAWFATGGQVIPLARRLRSRVGARACVVCGLDLSRVDADRCPRCSSGYARTLVSPGAPVSLCDAAP